MYRTASASKSILDKDILFEICEAETATQNALRQNGVCMGCEDSSDCLPPYSLLLLLRLTVGAMDASCSQLKSIYNNAAQEMFTSILYDCTRNYYLEPQANNNATINCPLKDVFQPSLVDISFGKDGNKVLEYTSSYFVAWNSLHL